MSNSAQQSSDVEASIDHAALLDILKESAEEVFSTMIGMVGVLVDEGSKAEPEGESEHSGPLVDFEALVEFEGPCRGAVVLKAGREGAMDIARGLLMMGDDEVIALEEVQDALGECANMLTGSLKTKALDPTGGFTLGIPRIGPHLDNEDFSRVGGLVYRLSKGFTSVEIWMEDSPAGK